MTVAKKLSIASLVESGEAEIKTGPFGTQLKASDYVGQGTPVINVRNIGFGSIREADLEYISDETVARLASHVLKPNDIVFGRKGAVERHAYLRGDHDRWLQGSDCIRLRFLSDRVNPRFVSYYLLTREHQHWMKQQCSHGATMASLNQDIVGRIEIPWLPIFVQDRIASVLGSYDDLVENNTKRIKILEEMAHSLYREWFVNFRFPGHQNVNLVDSPGGKVPERWRLGTLEEIVSLQRGFDITKAQQREGPYPVISSSGPGSKHDEYRIEGPGVIIGRKGTLGTVFFNEGPYWPHDTTLWVTDFHGHGPWFCFYMLKELQLAQYDCGASNPTINRNHIHKIGVIVPPAYLTREYDKLAEQLMRLAWVLRESSGNLRRTRDLVLPRLVSGEFDVSRLEALGA